MSDHSMHIPNLVGWPTRPIREVCELVSRGFAPVYVDRSPVKVIGQRCVQESGFNVLAVRFNNIHAKRVLAALPGDVLLNSTGTGTIGRSCVFREETGDYIVDSHVTVLRASRSKLDPYWLNALLLSRWGQQHLESHCYTGSTNQIELARSGLLDTNLPLPPIGEQQQVAEIIDTLDSQIAISERTIGKLVVIAGAITRQLLDQHGWPISRMRDVCSEITVGIVVRPAQYYVESGIPILRSQNIRSEGIDMTDLKYMSLRDHQVNKKSSVKPGDIVTVRTGYPGLSAVIPATLRHANCVDILISRPSSSVVPEYLCLWINSEFGRGQVLRAQGGLAQQHFNAQEMNELSVAVPPLAEQQAIADMLMANKLRIRSEREELEKIRLLKHGLMDDLLTGRVRVPGAGVERMGDWV